MSEPGSDLPVAPGPGCPGGLTIPARELDESFTKSSGPGGQSVNTTDSRVELRFDVTASTAFSEEQRERVVARIGPAVVVTASEHRSQHRNRVAARTRLADLVRDAVAPPPPSRRPTRPSRSAKRRRVEEKKQRGRTKSLRGRVRDD